MEDFLSPSYVSAFDGFKNEIERRAIGCWSASVI